LADDAGLIGELEPGLLHRFADFATLTEVILGSDAASGLCAGRPSLNPWR
jgi:hypothetical protein